MMITPNQPIKKVQQALEQQAVDFKKIIKYFSLGSS